MTLLDRLLRRRAEMRVPAPATGELVSGTVARRPAPPLRAWAGLPGPGLTAPAPLSVSDPRQGAGHALRWQSPPPRLSHARGSGEGGLVTGLASVLGDPLVAPGSTSPTVEGGEGELPLAVPSWTPAGGEGAPGWGAADGAPPAAGLRRLLPVETSILPLAVPPVPVPGEPVRPSTASSPGPLPEDTRPSAPSAASVPDLTALASSSAPPSLPDAPVGWGPGVRLVRRPGRDTGTPPAPPAAPHEPALPLAVLPGPVRPDPAESQAVRSSPAAPRGPLEPRRLSAVPGPVPTERGGPHAPERPLVGSLPVGSSPHARHPAGELPTEASGPSPTLPPLPLAPAAGSVPLLTGEDPAAAVVAQPRDGSPVAPDRTVLPERDAPVPGEVPPAAPPPASPPPAAAAPQAPRLLAASDAPLLGARPRMTQPIAALQLLLAGSAQGHSELPNAARLVAAPAAAGSEVSSRLGPAAPGDAAAPLGSARAAAPLPTTAAVAGRVLPVVDAGPALAAAAAGAAGATAGATAEPAAGGMPSGRPRLPELPGPPHPADHATVPADLPPRRLADSPRQESPVHRPDQQFSPMGANAGVPLPLRVLQVTGEPGAAPSGVLAAPGQLPLAVPAAFSAGPQPEDRPPAHPAAQLRPADLLAAGLARAEAEVDAVHAAVSPPGTGEPIEPPTNGPGAPEPAPTGGEARAVARPTDLRALADELYQEVRFRLRDELLAARERTATLTSL